MSEELDKVLEEMARQATRLDNLEGYFSNFDITLNNHMTEYNKKLLDTKNSLNFKFSFGFWVLFGLLTLVLAGFVTGAVVMLQVILEGL